MIRLPLFCWNFGTWGVLAVLLACAPVAVTHAQLGTPSTKPKTPIVPRPERDPGPYQPSLGHFDLSSINSLIVKLTKEFGILLNADEGHFFSPATLKKMAELRRAVQARRRMQMMEILQQAVDELAVEEEAASRSGRAITQQEADRRAEEAETQIAENIRQQSGASPQAPTDAPRVSPPVNQPASPPVNQPASPPSDQPVRPSIPDAPTAQSVPSDESGTKLNAAWITYIEKTVEEGLGLSDRRIDKFIEQHPQNPEQVVRESIEKIEKELRVISNTEADRLRERLQPVVDRVAERARATWLDKVMNVIPTTPNTQAERAESEARQTWRQTKEDLKKNLDRQDQRLRQAERNLQREQNQDNREAFAAARQNRIDALNELTNHIDRQPR